MDYHVDKFQDTSLMVYRKGQLYALSPVSRLDDTLYSHQGLACGGFITKKRATTVEVCEVFMRINEYLNHSEVQRAIYKPMPWIYHCYPAEEDLYVLTFTCHAQLTVRDISSTIPFDSYIKLNENRRNGVKKAKRASVTVRESQDLATFWDILDKNFINKYATHLTHSLEESTLLRSRFPSLIRLFMAYNNKGVVIGGIIIYEISQIIHSQYISASPEGKKLGAIDLLFDYIPNSVYANRKDSFDFGKSTEEEGKTLNTTLIFQKEGFGGQGVCYDCYEWETDTIIE